MLNKKQTVLKAKGPRSSDKMQVDECSTHYHQYIGHPDKNMSNETPVTLYHGTHGLNISTYRTVHPTAVEYTFFVAAHRTSSKIK